MSKLYAKCPVHGLFETEGFGAANSIVTFTGNRVRCPICGQISPLLDGTFEFDEYGVAEFVSGPDLTRDIYERFKVLVESVKMMPEGKFNSEEFIRQTDHISPQLAQGLTHYIQKSGVSLSDKAAVSQAIIAFLMLVLELMSHFKEDKPSQTTNNYNTTNQYYIDQNGNQTPYINNRQGFYPKSKQKSASAEEAPQHDKVVDSTHTESTQKTKKKKRRKHQPIEIISETIIERTDSTKRIIQRIIKRQ